MCCHTRLGHTVHIHGPNLNLYALPESSEQQRMQRLISIRFRNRYVVLELARHRFVQIVNHTQRPVTLIDCIYYHSDSENVAEL